ncbi:27655_t:CDS:2, partial [Gigaspora margarita]
MPKSTIGYYAVRIGRKSEIYMNWKEYKKQIYQYPDRYCENNGKKNALASIGIFFDDDDPKNLSERLSGVYQTNNRAELYAAICALEKVNNEQDLLVFTDRKSIFKHVKGHSDIYENEQADRLAYLGSQKTD